MSDLVDSSAQKQHPTTGERERESRKNWEEKEKKKGSQTAPPQSLTLPFLAYDSHWGQRKGEAPLPPFASEAKKRFFRAETVAE